MPLRKQSRYVETTPDELNAWLGIESGEPVQIATEDTDLVARVEARTLLRSHEREQSKLRVPPKEPKC
jgi:hypothetical protein